MILALLLTWATVSLNCDGSLITDLHHYAITYGAGMCDGSGEVAVCIPAWHTDVDVEASTGVYNLPFVGEPSIGEVWWWRVEAVDGAGNSSEDCR